MTDNVDNKMKDVHVAGKATGVWKKIIQTVMRNKRCAIPMLISVVVLAALEVLLPVFNMYAIDIYFYRTPYGDLNVLEQLLYNVFETKAQFIVSYFACTVIFGITLFFYVDLAGKVESTTSYYLRQEAYDKIQRLSFSYFDNTPQGWLMARMTSDSRRLANIISWGVLDLLWGFLTMFGILVFLCLLNIKLALVLLVLTPIMIVFTFILRKKMLVHFRKSRQYNSEIVASYNESFMGNAATKSLVIEERNSKEFLSLSEKMRKATIRAKLLASFIGPVLFMLGYIGVAFILNLGTNMYVTGVGISLSVLYIFVDYTVRYFEPVMQISRVLADFQAAQASAERIISLIDTQPEITDSAEVIEKYGDLYNAKRENWDELKGDVEFKNVTFRYSHGETVLENFNLTIHAGENIALVGHTGGGKSSIVNLLCRFYEPVSGSILIDGVDYRERSIGWLHSRLGYVLQTPQLFSGTIKDNIKYGSFDASDERVEEVARCVRANEFIDGLEKRYDTDIGESGNKLSLGEKQLISFARAIISDPRILVLDEATSSVDTQTEYLVQQAINEILKNRTSIVVAHRLSTIVNADKILVIDGGKIVESGKHKELLEKKGAYYELFKTQFMKDMEEKLLNN